MGLHVCTMSLLLPLLLLAGEGSGYSQQEEDYTDVPVTDDSREPLGPKYYWECDSNEECGEGRCIYGSCHCSRGFFYFSRSCKRCPGLNEYCGFSKCCEDAKLYYCGDDEYCRCKVPEAKSCREQSSHLRSNSQMMTAFQVVLASAFSVALLALMVQCWRTCCGCYECRKKLQSQQRTVRQDAGVPSLPTSVQGVQPPLEVSTITRDAPPSYDDLNHLHIEKPPSYLDVVNASTHLQVGSLQGERLPHILPTAPTTADVGGGVENAAFTSDDCRNTESMLRAGTTPEDRGHVTEGRQGSENEHPPSYEVAEATSRHGGAAGHAAPGRVDLRGTSQHRSSPTTASQVLCSESSA